MVELLVHTSAKPLRIALFHEFDNGVFKRIVHNRIEFLALKIFSSYAVRNLVGRVLPHFADYDGVRIAGFDAASNPLNEIVEQFVNDVKPPAAYSERGVFLNNSVFARNEIYKALVRFIRRGQNVPTTIRTNRDI